MLKTYKFTDSIKKINKNKSQILTIFLTDFNINGIIEIQTNALTKQHSIVLSQHTDTKIKNKNRYLDPMQSSRITLSTVDAYQTRVS